MAEHHNLYADPTPVPPRAALPGEAQTAYDQREKALDKFNDFETDNYDVLCTDWEAIAERADQAAARDALAAGTDPFAGPSAVDTARSRRARAIEVLRSLASAVRRTDRALTDAVRAAGPALVKTYGAELKAAESAYEAAHAAFIEARGRYGAAVNVRRHLVDMERRGQVWFPPADSANPLPIWGGELSERGMAETNSIRSSYKSAGINDFYGETGQPSEGINTPVRVTSRANGSVITLPASQAATQVRAGNADYVDPNEVPERYRPAA